MKKRFNEGIKTHFVRQKQTKNAKICLSLTAGVNNLATLYFYYLVTQCVLTVSKNNAEEYVSNPDWLKITSLCPIL